jgi:hypothetical protein
MSGGPTTSTTHSESAAAPARGLPRPLLWVLLVVAVAANGTTSLLGLPLVVSATLGVLALALGALLVRDHYQRRTRP